MVSNFIELSSVRAPEVGKGVTLHSHGELPAELAAYTGPQRDMAETLHARLAGLHARFGRDA